MTLAIIDARKPKYVIIGAGAEVVGALTAQAKVSEASSAASAASADTSSEIALAASITAPNVYPTTSAGLAAVSEGQTFWSNQTGSPVLYRKISGLPVQLGTLNPTADKVSFQQAGAGAISRTAQAKMEDIVSSSDFPTLGAAWAAAGRKLLIDPVSGKVLITATDTPLDYSASRAGFIYQGRDSVDIGLEELIPNVVFDMNYTGQGWVDAANRVSRSIGMGVLSYVGKQGDGSAHAFTVIGELKARGTGAIGTGTGGYNELGGYQGTLTNLGSTRGNISGYEFITQDGTAAVNFDTDIKNCIARVARFNNGTRQNVCFMASSEGTVAVDAILTVNAVAFNQFKVGLDLASTTFTSGFAATFPNNTTLAWKGSDGVVRPVLGSSNIGISFLRPSEAGAWTEIQTSGGATLLKAENFTDSISIYVNGSLKRVTQGAADSGGAGFRLLRVEN